MFIANPHIDPLSKPELAQVQELVEQFEEAWLRGDRPAIADHLPPDPRSRGAALLELVHTDLEYRLKAGETARVEEYGQAYPELAQDRTAVLELIVAEYHLRRRSQPDLGQEEYFARFSQYRAELLAKWETPPFNSAKAHPAAAMAPADDRTGPVPPAGSRLGKYELLEVVGRGGFGVVYRARDSALGRTVAVKVPRWGNLVTSEDTDRFLREARSAAGLQHPSIVPLHEVGQSGGLCYLVYAFVPGTTLADRLKAGGLNYRQAAELVAQTAEALDYAHHHGIIHRDLKPSNILLDEAGQPHVMDFGLAKRQTSESALTQEGDVLGTPAYMSPEQARGEASRVDARTDVYSLGVVLYELLTGEAPFRGMPERVLAQVLVDEPRPPRRLNDRLPRDLETICLHCLHKESRKRYASAGALARDLRRFLAGEPIEARPVGAWERAVKWVKRRPAWAALYAVSTAVVAGLLVGGFWYAAKERRHAEEARTLAVMARRHQYVAEVRLAYEAWDRSHGEEARELLERQRPQPGQPDLREFAWYYLWGQCNHDLVLRGHTAAVTSLAFSPDGQTLATASQDKTVKLWDVATWTERATLAGHTRAVRCLAFTPDGHTLATGGVDRTIRLWDVTGGGERSTLGPQPGVVYGVAFSPDGQVLAVATGSDGIGLWNPITGQEQATLRSPVGGAYTVAFSPDGQTLAATYHSAETTLLWALPSGKVRASLIGAAYCLAFSPDGRTLAGTRPDRTTRLWDVATGKERLSLRGHAGDVRGAAFAPDGQTIATASWDETAKLWTPATGQEQRTFKGHTGRLNAVAFAPGGDILATAGEDKTIRLWRRDGSPLSRPEARSTGNQGTAGASDTAPRYRGGPVPLAKHAGPIGALAFSPDGTTLAVGAQGMTLWDTATATQRPGIPDQIEAGTPLFLLDGKTLFTCERRVVTLRDAATLHELSTFEHQVDIYAAALSPDARTLATGGGTQGFPGEVKLWDAQAQRERASLHGHTDFVRAVAFSHDGAVLATGSADELVKLWDVHTAQERATLRGHDGGVYALAFSPDGRTLASGGTDNTIKLWDLQTGQERASLAGHTGPVLGVTFTPNDTTLASASLDGTVRLWDRNTHRELAVLRGHTDRINCLTFSPDGKVLASGGFDRIPRLWYAAADE
jgi:WD40 repeat protein